MKKVLVFTLLILGICVVVLSRRENPQDDIDRIFDTGHYKRFPKPNLKPASLKEKAPEIKVLQKILDRYDEIYQENDDFCRRANSVRDSLSIDGRVAYSCLMLWECKGNPYKVGDTNLSDHAYGSLQIRQPALTDLIRRRGFNKNLSDFVGDSEDALVNSVEAFHEYTAIYLKKGETRNLNAWLNTWNGGPKGTTKKSKYTEKVRRSLSNFHN